MHEELTLDDGHDSTLLNGRRTLETIRINTWAGQIQKYPFDLIASTIPLSSSALRAIASNESIVSS